MVVFLILSIVFGLGSFLPEFRLTHWIFRSFDFFRLHLLIAKLILFTAGFLLFHKLNIFLFVAQVILISSIIYQLFIIAPYLKRRTKNNSTQSKNLVSIISVNVLQKNTNYQKLIDLIRDIQPDIVLTMETNKDWEEALKPIENDYPFCFKIPKENRYGMHFYTRLEVKEIKKHYLISEERPAIEAHLIDRDDTNFLLWGIHPPPPSPTEKPTSKQKDAELMKAAKMIKKSTAPCVAIGDFNNVCWSRASRFFSKISGLNDARLGRGIYATFPVKPRIFRFPLDLLFNSPEITIKQIRLLPDIGSDHLPFFCEFYPKKSNSQSKSVEPEVKEEAESMIQEGHEAVKEEGGA